ncbi:MAG: MFS transporter, partial [Chitinophagaceae bacterium]
TGASFTTATAYIADISTPEKKAQNFGVIGAAFGMGFIIGPVIGGLLTSLGPWLSSIDPRLQTLGLRLPFLFSAFLSFINWLYGYFILPESLALEHRQSFSWRNANPLGSLLLLKKYRALLGLVAAFLLIYLGGSSVMTTWSYYNMEKFNWHEKEVGVSLGVVGIMVAFVQGFLMRKTLPVFGQERSVYIGLTCYALGLILFALATQGWMMYAFTIVYCLGGISGPALQGIISNHVPPNEQGALQGALTSLISLSSILGPLMMTGLFSYFTSPGTPLFFPGASFLMGALLMIGSLYFSYRTLFTEKHQTSVHS